MITTLYEEVVPKAGQYYIHSLRSVASELDGKYDKMGEMPEFIGDMDDAAPRSKAPNGRRSR